MTPPQSDFEAFLNLGGQSPQSDIDATSNSNRSTPSLHCGSSVVPSPEAHLLGTFDTVVAPAVDHPLLAALMSAMATMTPQQQQQFLSSVATASSGFDHSASPPSDSENAFIQFNTQTGSNAFANNSDSLSNWLQLSLVNGNSPVESASQLSTQSSPQSTPLSSTDPFLSMLLAPNAQQHAPIPTVDPRSTFPGNISVLTPPPSSATLTAPVPTPSTRSVPEIAALISQVYGDRSTSAAALNIPNLLEIVQSALGNKAKGNPSAVSSSDAQRKESRQRKHDEVEEDGSGSDDGVAQSRTTTKRRKALTIEEKEEKQKERMLRNRAAAQESRDKKKRYVENLESMTADLQSENSQLQARLRHSESKNRLLESRLEMLASQFVAQMASKSNHSLLPSPPSSTNLSQSPVLDASQADSAEVDFAGMLSPHSSSLVRRASSFSRPLSESPRRAGGDPTESLDDGSFGVGSNVAMSSNQLQAKQPLQFAFGDADAFVIPSFVDTRSRSVRLGTALNSFGKGVLTSPQRTLWASSWSTTPMRSVSSAVRETGPISRKVVGKQEPEVVIKEEDGTRLGVPSVTPSLPPQPMSSKNGLFWASSDASVGSHDLALISGAVVQGMLLWVVDVTAGGVAGRWRGRPGAGSGARWGFTGTAGSSNVSQPLLQTKRSWQNLAGLRASGSSLSSSSQRWQQVAAMDIGKA
ncbi:hypothetical protein BJ742DRAFT_797750 [Cladochytrium replicatum]|nr:hypothetical protein BJ742DRAFT_797750 [Cladochytrium replicatum]